MFKKLTLVTTLAASSGMLLGDVRAEEPSPRLDLNDSFIRISGTVDSAMDDSFVLKYSNREKVLVEVDDWDEFDEAQSFSEGKRVTVYGRIDQDLYESGKVEAGAIYVHDDQVYHVANPADEEDYHYQTPVFYHVTDATFENDLNQVEDGRWITLSGKVNHVIGRTIHLDVGYPQFVEVETISLGYNPFNDVGTQRITEGDHLVVHGKVNDDFFAGKSVSATRVIEVHGAS